MKLLRIDSSARKRSVSHQLADSFVAQWKNQCPDGKIVSRDLGASVIPAIGDEWVTAARSDPGQRTPSDRQVLALSDGLVDELEAANIILIGAPMHNFTISAQLKAWIDQVVRPGRTERACSEEERLWSSPRAVGPIPTAHDRASTTKSRICVPSWRSLA